MRPNIIEKEYTLGFPPMRSVIATTPFMPINVGSIVMIAPGRIVYRQHIRNVANTWRPDRREGCMMQGKPGLKVNSPKAGARKLASPFPTVKKSGKSPSKFQPLSKKERTKIYRQGKDVRNYIDKRQKWETQKPVKSPVKSSKKSSKRPEPNKVRFPKSPIAAKPTDGVDRKKTPPNRYKAPKLNPSVEPLQRRSSVYRERSNVKRPVNKGKNRTFRRQTARQQRIQPI